MATEKNIAPAPAVVGEVEPTLAISEFCARLSETVKRTELIGAFAHVEQAAGRALDTAANFRARFDKFVNKPV